MRGTSRTLRSIFFGHNFALSGQIRKQTPGLLNLCCPKMSVKVTNFEGTWSERAQSRWCPPWGKEIQILFFQVPSGMSKVSLLDISEWICQLKPYHLPGPPLFHQDYWAAGTSCPLPHKAGTGEGHKERGKNFGVKQTWIYFPALSLCHWVGLGRPHNSSGASVSSSLKWDNNSNYLIRMLRIT